MESGSKNGPPRVQGRDRGASLVNQGPSPVSSPGHRKSSLFLISPAPQASRTANDREVVKTPHPAAGKGRSSGVEGPGRIFGSILSRGKSASIAPLLGPDSPSDEAGGDTPTAPPLPTPSSLLPGISGIIRGRRVSPFKPDATIERSSMVGATADRGSESGPGEHPRKSVVFQQRLEAMVSFDRSVNGYGDDEGDSPDMKPNDEGGGTKSVMRSPRLSLASRRNSCTTPLIAIDEENRDQGGQ
jgi:hypothetical protein